MGFWGIEVKPGKPYPFYSEDALGILHITQATLGRGSSIEKSIVQCSVGDESPIFLCSLLPDKIESIPLNLEFDEDNSVAFSVIGPRSVHLSGFFKVVDSKDSFGVDHDSDSYGEDIAETDTDESGSTDFDTEEEYEDDFIDDGDLKMFSTSPVLNRGVIIEEIFDDDKPANGNSRSKRLKKKSQVSESEDNDKYEKQIVVKSGSGDPVLESEDEDGFPIPTPLQGKPNVQKPEVDAEAEEEMDQKNAKKTKKRTRDGISHEGSSKRKANGNVQDGQPESEAPQPISSSHLSTEAVPENNVKQENKKKQKTQSKGGKAQEKSTGLESNDLPIGNEEDEKLTNEKSMEIDADSVPNQTEEKKKRKKKKKKGKTLENGGDANTDETVKADALDKEEAKASQVRTFPNGLVIEEIAMGTPDGKRASPGKKVSVVYIGKLQKNGKIFDSNFGGLPFKFRLGIGQVIKGWDVGVNGMRIGDKRRLTIPPSMGYGAKGAGNAIPPNAWLLFDVELIDVR